MRYDDAYSDCIERTGFQASLPAQLYRDMVSSWARASSEYPSDVVLNLLAEIDREGEFSSSRLLLSSIASHDVAGQRSAQISLPWWLTGVLILLGIGLLLYFALRAGELLKDVELERDKPDKEDDACDLPFDAAIEGLSGLNLPSWAGLPSSSYLWTLSASERARVDATLQSFVPPAATGTLAFKHVATTKADHFTITLQSQNFPGSREATERTLAEAETLLPAIHIQALNVLMSPRATLTVVGNGFSSAPIELLHLLDTLGLGQNHSLLEYAMRVIDAVDYHSAKRDLDALEAAFAQVPRDLPLNSIPFGYTFQKWVTDRLLEEEARSRVQTTQHTFGVDPAILPRSSDLILDIYGPYPQDAAVLDQLLNMLKKCGRLYIAPLDLHPAPTVEIDLSQYGGQYEWRLPPDTKVPYIERMWE